MRSGDCPVTAVLPWGVDFTSLHSRCPSRYPQLLESAVSGPQGRFDILFACPGPTLRLDREGARREGRNPTGARFIDALDAWASEEPANYERPDLPFSGGWFLFLGYELVSELEPRLKPLVDPLGLPLALATRFPCALIRDHQRRRVVSFCEPGHENDHERIQADVTASVTDVTVGSTPLPRVHLSEEPGIRFTDGVGRIKRYIRDGDVFQVNLSRRWRGEFEIPPDPTALYSRLRSGNPAPFAALVDLGQGTTVISSSPERLVSVRRGTIETRPIAGTRPRGDAAASDLALSVELLAHPKERAEHIMLIDLERNDLGRVCEPGSVVVDELMSLESYRHVHHIVSNVRGRLRDNVSAGQVIRAVFPGGTITGCPKVRCMEIISELEQEGRGAYTGSVGYLTRHGDMDLNILIRTLVLRAAELSFRTGAGIVADSDPIAELAETRHKAEGLLRALQ